MESGRVPLKEIRDEPTSYPTQEINIPKGVIEIVPLPQVASRKTAYRKDKVCAVKPFQPSSNDINKGKCPLNFNIHNQSLVNVVNSCPFVKKKFQIALTVH